MLIKIYKNYLFQNQNLKNLLVPITPPVMLPPSLLELSPELPEELLPELEVVEPELSPLLEEVEVDSIVVVEVPLVVDSVEGVVEVGDC